MSEKNDLINNMIEELVKVLKHDHVTIGASAMICLLIHCAQDSGTAKEVWLDELSHAWDHYV
jgi:hypothetical protein